jgi:hypothetical protein
MNTATVMWGVKNGDPDWMETILSTQPERFEEVKAMARRDGWGRFRVARINLDKPPDFAKTVGKPRGRTTLSGVERVLSGRAQVERPGDPIIPWVKKLARVLMEKMGRPPSETALADKHYEELVDEAREQAEIWKTEGRDDLVSRLSTLLKTDF